MLYKPRSLCKRGHLGLYRNRSAPKGGANYATVAKHCDKLAQLYDDAAKEAEGVSAELGKQPQ